MREQFDTKLDRWLWKHDIKPAHLARESGYSRQHLLRLRAGRMDPTRKCIASIVTACRRLSGLPVEASDLFHLDSEESNGDEKN